MNYPCVESTIELNLKFVIRVWLNETTDALAKEYDNVELENQIFRQLQNGLDQQEIACWIAQQPHVNAVHVRDPSTGRGRVIYVNWP